MRYPPLTVTELTRRLKGKLIHTSVSQKRKQCLGNKWTWVSKVKVDYTYIHFCSCLTWVTVPLLICNPFFFQSLVACGKLNQLSVQHMMNASSVSELRHSPRLHVLCPYNWDLITLNTTSLNVWMNEWITRNTVCVSICVFPSHRGNKLISTTSNIQHFSDDQNQCLFCFVVLKYGKLGKCT